MVSPGESQAQQLRSFVADQVQNLTAVGDTLYFTTLVSGAQSEGENDAEGEEVEPTEGVRPVASYARHDRGTRGTLLLSLELTDFRTRCTSWKRMGQFPIGSRCRETS